MQPRALAAVLGLAVLASAACGKSKEEERVDLVRRVCDGLVPGTTTFRKALADLIGEGRNGPFCGGQLTPEGAGDVCDYGADVCQQDVIFVAHDLSACTTGPGGGCVYGCVLRGSRADIDANGLDAKLCTRFFYGPQPCSAVEPVICQ